MFGFAVGLGAVTWVVLSEIMPTRLRTKAYSLFVSVNWVTAFLATLLTLTTINGLGNVKASQDDESQTTHEKRGSGALFIVYIAVIIASLLFIYFRVPETKGKTPEQLFGLFELSDHSHTSTNAITTHSNRNSDVKNVPNMSKYKASDNLNVPLMTGPSMTDAYSTEL